MKTFLRLQSLALLPMLAIALLGNTAHAATWVSLGRLNALTAMPKLDTCKQRIINNYWSSKPTYYPNNVNTYSSNNIEFVFNPDLSSLRTLTSNAPTYSKFKTALDAYAATTTAKSLSAKVSVGQYPGVSINLAYADSAGLVQGSGWGIAPSELWYYELQELCPQ